MGSTQKIKFLTLAINVNALRAGLDGLPPGQEEIMLEVDEDGVQYINT